MEIIIVIGIVFFIGWLMFGGNGGSAGDGGEGLTGR